MSIVFGFAVTSPIVTMSMVDQTRWRTLVYGNTPKAISTFENRVKKKDSRKEVCLLIGASLFNKVMSHKFDAVIVFDDVSNLGMMKANSGFQVADVSPKGDPVVVTHQVLASLLAEGPAEEVDPHALAVVTHLTSTVTKHMPSSLEKTGKMPPVIPLAPSAIQDLLTNVKLSLGQDDPDYGVILSHYCRYLFGIINVRSLGANITRKLSQSPRDPWRRALDVVLTPTGAAIRMAFQEMAATEDPDFRIGSAIRKYGLQHVSGDFQFLVAVFPPHRGLTFL